jgi:hypothetical protein
MERFPSGNEIIDHAISMRPDLNLDVDRRLMRRRECEYQVFQSLERAICLPAITKGFSTIGDFVSYAQSLLQRRKSRGGRSLELHARRIFLEERLAEGLQFDSMPNKQVDGAPDFIFPSIAAYNDPEWPAEKLLVLAAETTFKDRWRQVTREASRIPVKHLLTLQEGVSESQFREMQDAGVRLVVPSSLHEKYPRSVQPSLLTLDRFVAEVKLL